MEEDKSGGLPVEPAIDGSGREQRVLKLQQLKKAGFKPFGTAFSVTGCLSDIRVDFHEGRTVRVVGRLLTIRDMGKTVFADLHDGSGRFQVYAGKSKTDNFETFKLLDTGDQIGVEGELFVTRAGEKTIRVIHWTILSKALRPLPEKWHGLKDIEVRYRQRYLDLIANNEVRELFDNRARIIREIRSFLWEHGFVEVETPMMQAQAGGAAARPFKTRYTALGTDMYLRIAPELYLKRLLVGGYSRIFELNRNFRNEGLDKKHNPEFTMLEVYQAWSDVNGMKTLAEEMIKDVAMKVFGTLQVGRVDDPVDISVPWQEIAYADLVIKEMGRDWYEIDLASARARAETKGVTVETDWDHSRITHEIYEKVIEKAIHNPVFVTRIPRSLVPLAKACDDDPETVDVFELVIDGKEIAPGYSELNDPLEQRERFEAQAGEDAQKVDEDFLLALEYGMPPAGGMGIGIDRLVMVLTGAESIRDVILFPQLRVKKSEGTI